ncbi:MAG: DUF1176 domain-containing protein [Blastocatellia bacterium]
MSFNTFKVNRSGKPAPRAIMGRRMLLAVFLFVTVAGCAVQEQPRPGGNRPAAAGPAQPAKTAPALSKANLTYEDRKAWREILKWPDECEQAFDYPDKSFGGIEFHQLAEKQYVVQVTCTGGAYQGYQVYYFYDETGQQPAAKLLTFESRESQDEKSLTRTETTEVWGQATFDDKAKELKVFNRFRGAGDCGILATYGFVNGAPELKELRAKINCDGKGAENPEKWNKVAPRQ